MIVWGLSITFYMLLSLVIFFISIFGLLISNKNIIMYIICLEILFISVNINFVSSSVFLGEIIGILFVIAGLIIAGCETAIGLAFILALYRKKAIVSSSNLINLKGA